MNEQAVELARRAAELGEAATKHFGPGFQKDVEEATRTFARITTTEGLFNVWRSAVVMVEASSYELARRRSDK